MTFDEKARRRDTFDDESVPVEFPGRGVIYLPRPRLLYRRGRDEQGRPHVLAARTFGADYDAMIDRAAAIESNEQMLLLLFDVFEDLARRNYDFTAEEIDGFCVMDSDAERDPDTGLPEPWDSVWSIARGQLPKSNAPGP